jgi:hypothetical protein
MERSARRRFVIVVALICLSSTFCSGQQQVTVTVPRVGVQDSFYENFGVGWGGRWSGPGGHGFFNWGPGGVRPPFAPGFSPSGGFGFGLGGFGRGGSGWLGFYGASGSSRSIAMDSASLTVPNGGVGMIQDATLRPFVTGFEPVVGQYATSPVAERLMRTGAGENPTSTTTAAAGDSNNGSRSGPPQRRVTASSAEQGDISVNEIRKQKETSRAAEQQKQEQELTWLIADAVDAERNGRFGAARVRYRQAAARADGDAKQELLRRLRALEEK